MSSWNITTVVPDAGDADAVLEHAADNAAQAEGATDEVAAQIASAVGAVRAALADGAFGDGPFHVSITGQVGYDAGDSQEDEAFLSVQIRHGEHYVQPALPAAEETEPPVKGS